MAKAFDYLKEMIKFSCLHNKTTVKMNYRLHEIRNTNQSSSK